MPRIRWILIVSTHSRLKAAGTRVQGLQVIDNVSTHSRLKAAGRKRSCRLSFQQVSTHSRLKAAGTGNPIIVIDKPFQHTAA